MAFFFRKMEFFTIHIMALRKSVQLNMPYLIYKIECNCNFDEGVLSCRVFIFLKKAFDTVYHFILLQKLHNNYYGIKGIIHDSSSIFISLIMYNQPKLVQRFLLNNSLLPVVSLRGLCSGLYCYFSCTSTTYIYIDHPKD